MVSIQVFYINDSLIKFINNLDSTSQANILHAVNKLSIYGNELGLPLSKPIGHKIFELRIMNSVNIRILYTFKNNKAWILHIFKKKSFKIPKKEINLALQRMKLID
jgi:phage-related protein